MGYDVTYHSISNQELEYYVFDVLRTPELAQSRAEEITEDPVRQEELCTLYSNALLFWYQNNRDSDDNPIDHTNFNATYNLGVAALSGYLHPYWYSRDGALTFFAGDNAEVFDFFSGYSTLEDSPLSHYDELGNHLFTTNYTASGMARDIPRLKRWVDEHKEKLLQGFEKDGFESLQLAIEYCEKNDLFLIEACDIVVPFTNSSFTNLDNFRAHFLGTA